MAKPKQMALGIWSDDTVQVFERWKETMGSPRSRLDAARAKTIDGMLAAGYTVEDLQLAIFGCSVSSFHQGQNDRGIRCNDVTLICRDAEHVDKFILLAEKAITKRTQRAMDSPRLLDKPASAVPAHLMALVKKP